MTICLRRHRTHSPARSWNWQLFDPNQAECDAPDAGSCWDGTHRTTSFDDARLDEVMLIELSKKVQQGRAQIPLASAMGRKRRHAP